MLHRSTLLHLRVPFSFFLLPVYLFALAVVPHPDGMRAVLAFVLLHLVLYPATNAYNSFFDKDTESIGGLKNPPPVTKELLYVSWLLDGLAIGLGFLLGWPFAVGVLIYGLISKAYSYDGIRLKKYPWLSWLVASLFQGAFTFLLVYQGVSQAPLAELLEARVLAPAGLASLLLMGFYPMTQIYQHQEDGRRGDLTLSRVLGIRGTFGFTAAVFALGTVGFLFYLKQYYSLRHFGLFLLALLPALVYFGVWYSQVHRRPSAANYTSAMRLNLLSSLGTNVFFAWLGIA